MGPRLPLLIIILPMQTKKKGHASSTKKPMILGPGIAKTIWQNF